MLELAGYKIRPFVVVVPELAERTDFILKHFRECGLGEVETFEGLNSTVSGLGTCHTYEVDRPGSGWNIGPKCVGTWVAFWGLWSALKYMPEDYFLTMEWDAQFREGWREKLERALVSVPKDFDMLYLGSCCANAKPRTHIAGEVWDVHYPLCGHATIVARKCIPFILRTQRRVWAPLDISLMNSTLPGLKVYTVLPRLVDQFNTFIPS